MDVLFVHQNFPAQFLHIAKDLQGRPGVRALVVTDLSNEQPDFLPSARYRFDAKKVATPDRISRHFALHAARGRMAARAMVSLGRRGVRPEVIVGHVGWGETLFARDVFPKARLIVHAEFYYSNAGADVGFDPEFAEPATLDRAIELRAKNASILSALVDADVGVAPTRWQADQFPERLRERLTVLHEGIDTDLLTPDRNARYAVPGTDIVLSAEDEVITFVSRNLEPYRGYHVFMRALPAILAARPKAHAVVMGGDGVSYGPTPSGGGGWRQAFHREVEGRLPRDRVHFVGFSPFADFVALLRISSAHVYWTYPFVVSWSLLQAMSLGAPIVASRTAPVLEVVEDGVNGRLVDFFDVAGLSDAVVAALERPQDFAAMRAGARDAIRERFDLRRVCLPRWRALLGLPA